MEATEHEKTITNRINKAFRLVDILVDRCGVESPADVAHFTDEEWANVCRVDAELEGMKFRPPSEKTIAATLSILFKALDDSDDPFEGLI